MRSVTAAIVAAEMKNALTHVCMMHSKAETAYCSVRRLLQVQLLVRFWGFACLKPRTSDQMCSISYTTKSLFYKSNCNLFDV